MLGFEDDELGSSPGWFGNAVATFCPDRPSQHAAELVSKHSDTYAAPLCSLGWVKFVAVCSALSQKTVNSEATPRAVVSTNTPLHQHSLSLIWGDILRRVQALIRHFNSMVSQFYMNVNRYLEESPDRVQSTYFTWAHLMRNDIKARSTKEENDG